MLLNKYETKTHTVTERVLTSQKRYCDVCKTQITGHYWSICTQHSDWGAESVESIEHTDACSASCLMEKLAEYVENSNGENNTYEIEVVHQKTACVQRIDY